MRGLGLLYSTKESVVVIREDVFLCAIKEGKRLICSNKGFEGVTCTCGGGENARVWLVDTVGNIQSE